MGLKVKELIEKLSEMPQESEVVYKEFLFNTDMWTAKNVENVSVLRDKVLLD